VEIRANPALHAIPIVILTTSYEEKDIEFSMNAGADSFITKPSTFVEWEEKMKSLSKCWLEE
jgi:CheY-like chemotaxis protein